MIENVMKMGGTSLFGVISICIFFVFFSGMLLWAAVLKKPYLNLMRNLPLDDGSATGTNQPSAAENRHE
jgi:hypothetical protein